MRCLAILIFWLGASRALARTIAILTDEPDARAAKNLIHLIQTTPPFSRMENLKVTLVQKSQITCVQAKDAIGAQSDTNALPKSCQSTETRAATNKSLKRLIVCTNELQLAAVKAENNADFMVFVKKSTAYGGSGGEIPTVSTGSPVATGLHELLHRMGFADEYAYPSACEADLYCRDGQLSANVTEFEDDPPYSSDQVARLRHGGQIPWFAKIKAKTKITTATQLGTPTHGVIGLFPAKTCKNVSGHFKSWQPGEGVSVMEDIFSNHIPEATWPTIAAALGEKISDRPLRAETFLAQKVKAAPAASGKKSFRKSSESSRSAK